MEQEDEKEEIKAEICDKYCRFPFMIKNQEKMDKICEECPLNRL